MSDQEIEVKLYVKNLPAVEEHLQAAGAQLMQARVFERNLRFDLPDGSLGRSMQVLRLRQDTAARLTYKGPGYVQDGVRVRQELEFTVGDFEMARAVLQALGYQVVMIYEKYRAEYDWEGMHVALDELPYGNFVEIEGPDVDTLRAATQRLGLKWETAVPESYVMLFDRLRAMLDLPFRDLAFENFQGVTANVEMLKVQPAD